MKSTQATRKSIIARLEKAQRDNPNKDVESTLEILNDFELLLGECIKFHVFYESFVHEQCILYYHLLEPPSQTVVSLNRNFYKIINLLIMNTEVRDNIQNADEDIRMSTMGDIIMDRKSGNPINVNSMANLSSTNRCSLCGKMFLSTTAGGRMCSSCSLSLRMGVTSPHPTTQKKAAVYTMPHPSVPVVASNNPPSNKKISFIEKLKNLMKIASK